MPLASPSRLNSCTAKTINVSSGNRFYAEVVRQRFKERKEHAFLPLAREPPKRDVKEQKMHEEESLSNHTKKYSRPLTPPSPSKRRKSSLLEECMDFGFGRVSSSTMITRTQSAEMNAGFYQLTLTPRVSSSTMITRTQSAEMNAEFNQLTLTPCGEA